LIDNYGQCPGECPGNVTNCREFICDLPASRLKVFRPTNGFFKESNLGEENEISYCPKCRDECRSMKVIADGEEYCERHKQALEEK